MQNIAIIGCGYIGKTHAAAIKKIPALRLAAVCDSNEDAGKKLAAESGCAYYRGAEDMIKNSGAAIVNVCVPTALHEQYVLLAAEHGKHVLCEKPFALSSDSAARMAAACEKSGVSLMVGQVVRWMGEHAKIRDIIQQGRIGGVRLVYCSRLAQHPNWAEWHRRPDVSGGGLFDLHIHDLDFLYSLFGPVDAVDAVGWKSPTGCWNHVISTLRFKNGIKAVAEGSMQMEGAYPFSVSFRAAGDGGTVDYKLSAGFNIENIDAGSLILYEKDKQPEPVHAAAFDAFEKEIAAFAAAVEAGAKPPIPVEESVAVIRIVEGLQKSLETGKMVTL